MSAVTAQVAAPYVWGAAIATGRSHAQEGTACQDWYGVETFSDASGGQWIVAAVADGAGSTEFGGEGAALVVGTFIDAIRSGADLGIELEQLARDALVLARFELEFCAEVNNLPLSAFATTFSGFVSNGVVSVFVQIGDGVMVAGRAWSVPITPHYGRFANEAVFVTCSDWFERLEVKVVNEPVETVVLSTDGFRDLIVRPFSLDLSVGFFEAATAKLSTAIFLGHDEETSAWLQALIGSDVVQARTHDDITIVALHRPDGAEVP